MKIIAQTSLQPPTIHLLTEGDESWFYHRRLGHNQSNACWIDERESPRKVVDRDRFEPKTMFCIFFRTTVNVHISYIKDGNTIDVEAFIKGYLKALFKEVIKQKPIAGLANIKIHNVAQTVKSFMNENKV